MKFKSINKQREKDAYSYKFVCECLCLFVFLCVARMIISVKHTISFVNLI